ncbi:hypothetical protein, partial [Enterobacter roggenkampii]|uniref:hypothetical protein n=1 Tax=Enterobacter roggenkampii TaxID=1812935 RepID=UPI001E4A3B1E
NGDFYFWHASGNTDNVTTLSTLGVKAPSAHQERQGCFPGAFRQPMTDRRVRFPIHSPNENWL